MNSSSYKLYLNSEVKSHEQSVSVFSSASNNVSSKSAYDFFLELCFNQSRYHRDNGKWKRKWKLLYLINLNK